MCPPTSKAGVIPASTTSSYNMTSDRATSNINDPLQQLQNSSATQATIHPTEKKMMNWPEDRYVLDHDSNSNHSHYPSSNICMKILIRIYHCYQCWTYGYMGTVLQYGSKANHINRQRKKREQGDHIQGQRITQYDLFRTPKSIQSAYITKQFQHYFNKNSNSQKQKQQHVEMGQEDLLENSNLSSSVAASSVKRGTSTTKATSTKWNLFYTLWHLSTPTFIPAGFCQLVCVLCQVSIPLLVRELLFLLEQNPSSNIFTIGLPYAIGIFIVACCNGLCNHRQRHLALKSGITIRAATVNILYQHVLFLLPTSSTNSSNITSGEITNLFATDTQKLFEVTQDGHLIWALPLSIILVTICLVVVMGYTTLAGIVVLILFVPVVRYITQQMISIRQKRIVMTDERIQIASSMLRGIKVTKLNSYESNYERRVVDARNKELVFLRQELRVWGMSLVLIVISPIVASAVTFAFYVLVDPVNNILTASKSFTVLLLFSALRFPINIAGRLLGKATQAYSAIQRIARFLDRDIRMADEMKKEVIFRPDNGDHSDEATDVALHLKDATFYIGSEACPTFTVSKFNMTVRTGEVIAVCGPVGSGKSSFVNGLIGEIAATSTSVVKTFGPIFLVTQDAFILNTTLRENILFGKTMDAILYDRVIEACCLRTDLELFGRSKDLTEIGERGITLSGGQKQRVSLARAAYATLCTERDNACRGLVRNGLVILDDPLSALDAGTSKVVFERLLKGHNALFANSAVVLVTHASHFLNRVDNIIVLVDGKNQFSGSWSDLISFQSTDEKVYQFIDFMRTAVQEEQDELSKSDRVVVSVDQKPKTNEEATADNLITVEEREHGLASTSTWLLWFKHAGGFYFLSFQILFMSIDRFFYVAVEYWLARWTNAATTPITVLGRDFPPQTDGRQAQYEYLTVFSLLLLASIISTTVRSLWAVTGGARAAKAVFFAMLVRVLGAPMSYFESTPQGRLLNRFTYDTEVIDVTLTQAMSTFIISCSWYVAGVAIIVVILPWMILAIVPITLAYYYLLLHYRKSGSDLQRLDAVSRSPIQAMVSEALDGSSTIRLFNQQFTFINRFQSAVDTNSSALLNFVSAQRWLGFRIEILGSLVCLVSSLLVISFNDIFNIDAGLVGLLILWSSHFTITLGFLVDTVAETEAAITAIERVDAMSRLPQEKSMITDTTSIKLPETWPEHGQLEFKDVCLRYRDNLPLALNGLTFTIPAGAKCGIVGRSGAGKSSLTAALFRLVEIESGSIVLDGVDLSTLGLLDVRGRNQGMVIIPQDPYLTGDTLRQCIDPFQLHTNSDILQALQSVRLASSNDTDDILNRPVEEGGSSYSVGERQLLNLARALLCKPRVLVLDESTASIDGETDAFIQSMIRMKFGNITQLVIAHRLETICDSDLIVVMDHGRAMEVDTPQNLIQMDGGLFATLVDATGIEGSAALRTLINNNNK